MLDDLGRTSQFTGLQRAPYDLTYDDAGRIAEIDQSGRVWSVSYDENGYPSVLQTPDGTVQFARDTMGRTTLLTEPDRTIDLAFHDGEPGEYDGTGQLLAAQTDAGVDVELAYDGFLLTDAVWLGEVDGSVSWNYGEQLFLDAIGVNGLPNPRAARRPGHSASLRTRPPNPRAARPWARLLAEVALRRSRVTT